MSFEVKTLVDSEPIKWLEDNTFLYGENNALYWCNSEHKKYQMPNVLWPLLYSDKLFYYKENNKIVEYNPLTGEAKPLFYKQDCPALIAIVKINNIFLIATNQGMFDKTGKWICPLFGVQQSYVSLAASEHKLLTYNEDYLLTYKIIKGFDRDTGNYKWIDRIDKLEVNVYKLPEFSLLECKTGINLPTIKKPEPETNIVTMYRKGRFERMEYGKYVRKAEISNEQFIKDHCKILINSIQVIGKVIEITTKTPKQKKKCCICFEKPNPGALLMFA